MKYAASVMQEDALITARLHLNLHGLQGTPGVLPSAPTAQFTLAGFLALESQVSLG